MLTAKNSGQLAARTVHAALNAEDRMTDALDQFVSVASFQPVDKITESAWAEHTPFAFWLVDALKPRCLVELGVFHGFSYLVMCQAASRLSPRARCYGVDNWTGDDHVGFYGEEVFQTL